MTGDTNQELLVKALTKLGWTQVEFYHPPSEIGEPPRKPFIRGINREGFYEDGSPLLTSLDAHNAPGSTIEYMAKRGFSFNLSHLVGLEFWEAAFSKGRGDDQITHGALWEDPATAITKAFVQHEEAM